MIYSADSVTIRVLSFPRFMQEYIPMLAKNKNKPNPIIRTNKTQNKHWGNKKVKMWKERLKLKKQSLIYRNLWAVSNESKKE